MHCGGLCEFGRGLRASRGSPQTARRHSDQMSPDLVLQGNQEVHTSTSPKFICTRDWSQMLDVHLVFPGIVRRLHLDIAQSYSPSFLSENN